MKPYRFIIFDLDSTLVKLEGLDWLAEVSGNGSKVKKITQLSMEGKIPLENALKEKLNLISPSYDDLVKLGEKYYQTSVEDATEVIGAFKFLSKEVWIITGNFPPAVTLFAEKIGISTDRIICNHLEFDINGGYKNFDLSQPLVKNGGKARIIKKYFDSKRAVFIGDAFTDLETKSQAELFIGYGGVVERKVVRESAEIYLFCESMAPLLEIILSEDEKEFLRKDPKYLQVLWKAKKLIKKGFVKNAKTLTVKQ
jgi:phosphoserine phosphatase